MCQNNCRLAEFQLKGIQYGPDIAYLWQITNAVFVICHRYVWSVLNSFKLKFGKSAIILTKCVTGNCSHVDKRLPSGPENERGPAVVPSRLCSKWEGVHCHETCR